MQFELVRTDRTFSKPYPVLSASEQHQADDELRKRLGDEIALMFDLGWEVYDARSSRPIDDSNRGWYSEADAKQAAQQLSDYAMAHMLRGVGIRALATKGPFYPRLVTAHCVTVGFANFKRGLIRHRLLFTVSLRRTRVQGVELAVADLVARTERWNATDAARVEAKSELLASIHWQLGCSTSRAVRETELINAVIAGRRRVVNEFMSSGA